MPSGHSFGTDGKQGGPVCLPPTVTIAISHVQDRAIVLGILFPRQEFRIVLQ